MTNSFLVCAVITTISAVVSLGFSIAAMLGSAPGARTITLYASARSLALAIVAAASFVASAQWLIAVSLGMIVVQACDAIIGLMIRDLKKTLGPAVIAIANLLAVFWLASV